MAIPPETDSFVPDSFEADNTDSDSFTPDSFVADSGNKTSDILKSALSPFMSAASSTRAIPDAVAAVGMPATLSVGDALARTGKVIAGDPETVFDTGIKAGSALAYGVAGAQDMITSVPRGIVDLVNPKLADKIPNATASLDATMPNVGLNTRLVSELGANAAMLPMFGMGSAALDLLAPATGNALVGPQVGGLVKSTVLGGAYGALRRPEEDQTRGQNSQDDMLMFGAIHGAGELFNAAVNVIANGGKAGLLKTLRSDIVDYFQERGFDPARSRAMADAGLASKVREYGGLNNVPRSDLKDSVDAFRAARERARAASAPRDVTRQGKAWPEGRPVDSFVPDNAPAIRTSPAERTANRQQAEIDRMLNVMPGSGKSVVPVRPQNPPMPLQTKPEGLPAIDNEITRMRVPDLTADHRIIAITDSGLPIVKMGKSESAPPAIPEQTIPEQIQTPEIVSIPKGDANKLSGTTEDALIAEARKYKTAEEFVESKYKELYHGTNQNIPDSKLRVDVGSGKLGRGLYTLDSEKAARNYGNKIKKIYSDENIILIDYQSIPENARIGFVKYLKERKPDVVSEIERFKGKNIDNFTSKDISETVADHVFVKAMDAEYNMNGKGVPYINADGFILDSIYGGKEIVFKKHRFITESEYKKTKSQLTDIWRKAHEIPATDNQSAINEKAVLASEFGFKGPASKRYTVDGKILGDTPEEAVALYKRESARNDAYKEEKQTRESILPKLKSGNYADSDIKKITRFGNTTASTSDTVQILRDLGLTIIKARKSVLGTGSVYTTSGGAELYDVRASIENARRLGFLPQGSIDLGSISESKMTREYDKLKQSLRNTEPPAPAATETAGTPQNMTAGEVQPTAGAGPSERDIEQIARQLADEEYQTNIDRRSGDIVRRVLSVGKIRITKDLLTNLKGEYDRIPKAVKTQVFTHDRSGSGIDEVAQSLGMSESELLNDLESHSTIPTKKPDWRDYTAEAERRISEGKASATEQEKQDISEGLATLEQGAAEAGEPLKSGERFHIAGDNYTVLDVTKDNIKLQDGKGVVYDRNTGAVEIVKKFNTPKNGIPRGSTQIASEPTRTYTAEEQLELGGMNDRGDQIQRPEAKDSEQDLSAKSGPREVYSALKVKFKKEGHLVFAREKIEGPQDVAFAFRFLHNTWGERAYMIGIRKGKAEFVECLGIGSISKSAVAVEKPLPSIIAKKCDSYYILHNHPGGLLEMSDDDMRVTYATRGAYDAIGVKFNGHIIINGTKFLYQSPDNVVSIISHHEVAPGAKKVPIYEKYIEWTESGELPKINGPDEAYELLKGYQKDVSRNQVGVVSVNSQNQIIAFHVMPRTCLTVKNITQTVSRTRAAGIFLMENDAPIGNVGAWAVDNKASLERLGVRLIDVVSLKQHGYESAMTNGILREHPALYDDSKETPTDLLNRFKKQAVDQGMNEQDALAWAKRRTAEALNLVKPKATIESAEQEEFITDGVKGFGRGGKGRGELFEGGSKYVSDRTGEYNTSNGNAFLEDEGFTPKTPDDRFEDDAVIEKRMMEELKSRKDYHQMRLPIDFEGRVDDIAAGERAARAMREGRKEAKQQFLRDDLAPIKILDKYEYIPRQRRQMPREILEAIEGGKLRDLTQGEASGLSTTGPNTAAEKIDGKMFGTFKRAFLFPIQDGDKLFHAEQKKTQNDIAFVFKGMTKAEKVLVREVAEGKAKTNDQKIMNAVRWARDKYDNLLDRMNAVRVSIGKDPIQKRKDYITHGIEISQAADLLKYISSFAPNSRPVDVVDVPASMLTISAHTKPNSPYFKFAKRRETDVTDWDAEKAMLNYIDPALRVIHMSRATKNARDILEYKVRMPSDFEGGKMDDMSLFGTVYPNAYRYFNRYIDQLTGKRTVLDREHPRAAALLGFTNRLFSSGSIAGNLSTVVTQLASFRNNLMELGPLYAAYGQAAINTPAGYRFYHENSRIGMNRQYEPSFQNERFLGSRLLSRVHNKISSIASKPISWLDQEMVGAAFLGAYKKGRQALDLGHEDAIRYADRVAEMTNASAAQVDRPPINQGAIKVGLNQFNTFVYNEWNTLRKKVAERAVKGEGGQQGSDVSGLGSIKEGRGRGIERLAWYIIGTIAVSSMHEYFGLPNPLRVEGTFQPIKNKWARIVAQHVVNQIPGISMVRFGGSPAAQFVIGMATMSDKKNMSSVIRQLKRVGWRLVPVGGQVSKTWSGLQALGDYGRVRSGDGKFMFRIPTDDFVEVARAVAFGPWQTNAGKKELQRRGMR